MPSSDPGAHVAAHELPTWLSAHSDGVTVEVKAVPRAKRTQAVGIYEGRLRVQIAAAPHDGESNAALCAYLADAAGIRPQSASIRRGSGGARKLVELTGDPARIAERLIAHFGDVAGAGS